jgi:hypothetical protein
MPRDIGTGLYHYPDGTPGNPGQTIFSTRYNTFINDLTNTLNQSLPVNMGGTGGTDGLTARTNLQAERAFQTITNFDSAVWECGSFYSPANSPGAPILSHPFIGIVYGDPAATLTIEARDIASPAVNRDVYTRTRNGGVWGTWTGGVNGQKLDGNLEIEKATPTLTLDSISIADQNVIFGDKVNLHRWAMVIGSALAETGGNVGSDFQILRYTDAGNFIDNPLAIERKTGTVQFSAPAFFTGANRFSFASPGAGGWYDSFNTGTRFFVGTETSLDLFRVFCAGAANNAFTVNGATAVTQFMKAISSPLGITGDDGHTLQFRWDGAGVLRNVDGATGFIRMWDNYNCPAAAVGSGAYQKLLSGQLLQFGFSAGGGEITITFPVVFPSQCQMVVATMVGGGIPADTMIVLHVDGVNTANFTARPRYRTPTTGGIATQGFHWFAVGF